MQQNDGSGNFNFNALARILGKKGSLSEDEIAQTERIPQEAIDTASGMMGTIKGIPGSQAIRTAAMEVAPSVEMSLADRIKQAVAQSKVKGPQGGITNSVAEQQQGLKQPLESFFDRFGPKEVTIPGGEKIPGQELKKLMPQEFINPGMERNLASDAEEAVKQEIKNSQRFQAIQDLLNK